MMTEAQHVYPIDKHLGVCIIFNMKDFKYRPDMRRDGTDVDLSMLKTTFSKFGYDVYPVQNSTKCNIEVKMREVLGKVHRQSSSFICVILSHGTTNNKISTYDGLIDLNEIIQMTDVPVLQGKPKIFIIQACRGSNTDRGLGEEMYVDRNKSPIQTEDMVLVPRKPDLLMIYATPPGYVSGRHPTSGSTFIQLLCQTLEQERDRATVCVLLQRLTMTISNIPVEFEGKTGVFLQVPYFMSTLRKSLMLRNFTCSGDNNFMTTSIIKDTQAEVDRRRNRVVLNKFDTLQHQYQAYQFLLKESHGCYDVSVSTARHCLIINKTTRVNFRRAEQDCNNIQKTMTALKFKVSNVCDEWEERLKECTARENIGCLFCFIQIDANNDTSDRNCVVEVIESVKKEPHMRNKPKVYIIQPYKTADVCASDSNDENIKSSLAHPIRHSKESDVLMVHVLPVKFEKKSFIEIFCDEYVDHAEIVPLMGFLERVLPGKYKNDWESLIPTVCSTMRKHLLMKDNFDRAAYQSEYVKPIEVALDVLGVIRNIFR